MRPDESYCCLIRSSSRLMSLRFNWARPICSTRMIWQQASSITKGRRCWGRMAWWLYWVVFGPRGPTLRHDGLIIIFTSLEIQLVNICKGLQDVHRCGAWERVCCMNKDYDERLPDVSFADGLLAIIPRLALLPSVCYQHLTPLADTFLVCQNEHP